MNQPASAPPASSVKARSGINMEIVIAILVSLIAVAAIVSSRKFPSTGLSTDIGSARFPMVYSIVLLVLCTILIVQNLRQKVQSRNGSAHTAAAAQQGLVDTAPSPAYRKSFSGILASVLCLGVMPYAGFALTAAVYMSFLMWLLGMKHKILNPLLTLAITAIVYFTFSSALNVPLPIGSFFDNVSA